MKYTYLCILFLLLTPGLGVAWMNESNPCKTKPSQKGCKKYGVAIYGKHKNTEVKKLLKSVALVENEYVLKIVFTKKGVCVVSAYKASKNKLAVNMFGDMQRIQRYLSKNGKWVKSRLNNVFECSI